MNILIIGHGSIGARHARNLRRLMPDVKLGIYDPPLGYTATMPEADAAVIASPTASHAAHMAALSYRAVPFLCEKPLGTLTLPSQQDRCAVNFQYRFHPAAAHLRALTATENVLQFHARDNLLARYGADVAGIMASHAIDLALWLLGPALRVELYSNGVALTGHIQHQGGASMYDYRMDAAERESYVTVRGERVDLPADDLMYVEALRAWTNWVKGGERDSRTATLADGMMVERILRSVQNKT